MTETTTVLIRNVDKETYQKARYAAIKANVNMGEWVTEAIKDKLKENKGG